MVEESQTNKDVKDGNDLANRENWKKLHKRKEARGSFSRAGLVRLSLDFIIRLSRCYCVPYFYCLKAAASVIELLTLLVVEHKVSHTLE